MNPIQKIIEESDEQFIALTKTDRIPEDFHEANVWLKANPDKHLFENEIYGEPMFDLSGEKILAFLHQRDKKILERVRELIKEKLDWWRQDSVVEMTVPPLSLGAVSALVEIYDLINQALK